jgi:hypothetical protein
MLRLQWQPPRRFVALPAMALAAAVLLTSGAAPATAASKPYHLDVGRRSDFVAQTNLVQCVGASMQMMMNMIGDATDRSAGTQLRYQRIARKLSGPRIPGRERRGASVFGWAAGLTTLGAGRYMVVGSRAIDDALLIAAQAIRRTGRPAGLLMWHGRHAWVMSGFRATKDPLMPGARVTSVIVEDPLYPLDSVSWGPSPAPGSRLTVAQLARQFVPRLRTSRSPQLRGKYVVVIPAQMYFRHRLDL